MANPSKTKRRDQYLEGLISYQDKTPIKVITGVRRCGKSTLLDLFEQHLLETGVTPEHILRMNFELMEFDDIQDYKQLYAYIREHLSPKGTSYVLLDEIQRVDGWEKAVNSLHTEGSADIYLTGSNAWLLASELSTLLAGRYVQIKMLPLSFKEYLDFYNIDMGSDLDQYFNRYLEFGGFPGIMEFSENAAGVQNYLEGIYNTIILRDVIQRNAVRDPALLEGIVRFLAANIGNMVTTRKISAYLTSQGRKTTADTVDNYLRMLEAAFIFYRARRYDLKGKMHLKVNDKYYLVDTGIRGALLGKRGYDYGHVLENVVFFDLIRRGYEVSIGKYDSLEVDFVATKPDTVLYVQVSASVLDSDTLERELKPLRSIPDNYEKILLTMDRLPYPDFEGIRQVNLIDFLIQ